MRKKLHASTASTVAIISISDEARICIRFNFTNTPTHIIFILYLNAWPNFCSPSFLFTKHLFPQHQTGLPTRTHRVWRNVAVLSSPLSCSLQKTTRPCTFMCPPAFHFAHKLQIPLGILSKGLKTRRKVFDVMSHHMLLEKCRNYFPRLIKFPSSWLSSLGAVN